MVGDARPEEPAALVLAIADEASHAPSSELTRALGAPARIVSLPPSTGNEAELPSDAAELLRIAARLRAQRPTRGKPLLLGAGRGGTVALIAAAREPSAWGAVVVVGAELPKNALPAGALPDAGTPPLRVYIHHGSRDAVTPVERGGAASDELALRGLAAVLHLDPHAGHELSPHLVAEMRARLVEEIRDLP